MVLLLVAAADDFIQSAELKFKVQRKDAPVTGIASLGNDLFIIRWQQQQIDVYDTENGATRSLPIPDLRSEQSCLAACGFYRCLYVTDDRNECIHKASSIGKSESMKICRIPVRNETTTSNVMEGLVSTRSMVRCQICSMAVTKDHNLLVACHKVHKLLEYTTDGVLVRQVNLNISNPVRVVQLPTGLYGVIHREDAETDCYSVVDINGKVTRRSLRFAKVRDTRYYRYMSIDDLVLNDLTVSRSGIVFIAASDGNKILVPVLRKTGDAFELQSLPESAYGGSLNQPFCVHFDDSKRRLYIGEGRGGRVLCCSAERK